MLLTGLALANGATTTTVSVQHSAASGTVEMRHCAYQMYATTKVRTLSSLKNNPLYINTRVTVLTHVPNP